MNKGKGLSPKEMGEGWKQHKIEHRIGKKPKPKEPHRSIADDRPATRYEKYDKDGHFEKHGVTHHENPRKRYTLKEIDDGEVRRIERGPRIEMLKKEHKLVETNPGPQNRERWAGKGRK